MAVRGPRPHLGTVRGKPRDFVPGLQPGFGEHFAQHENALAPESGDLDTDIEWWWKRRTRGVAVKGEAEQSREIFNGRRADRIGNRPHLAQVGDGEHSGHLLPDEGLR